MRGESVKGTKSLECGSNGRSILDGAVSEDVLVCCSCTGLLDCPPHGGMLFVSLLSDVCWYVIQGKLLNTVVGVLIMYS